jgi:predicted RNA binding protein YcfA (HicA-like mRNA interferase family)
MSKVDKILARIRQNPKTVRFDEIDATLMRYGFSKRRKGSHVFYARGILRFGLPVPHPGPHVAPFYVKKFSALMDIVLGEEDKLD